MAFIRGRQKGPKTIPGWTIRSLPIHVAWVSYPSEKTKNSIPPVCQIQSISLIFSPETDIPNTENQDIEEESEDEGLKFGDLLSPGGQKFNFGSFEQHEIRKLWKMRIAENKSTAINEYGSNFFKSKFDPLAAIEAKAALLAQNSAEEVNSMKPSACEEMIMADRKELAPQAPSSPMGTQEAPEVEWSSQETTTLLTQDGAMEETNLQKATKNMECDKPIAGDKSEIEQPQQSPDGSMQEEDVGLATDLPDKATLQEEEISKKDPTNPQEVLADRRHSERLKNQGTGTLNMSEKAEALKEKKNLPGNSQPQVQNSFAALSNDAIISISSKMGINVASLSFEFCDFLRDLERARSNLETRNEEKESGDNDQTENLPLEEIKLISWQSDESDDEGFKIVMSRKKKKSIKKAKRTRVTVPQPDVGGEPLGGGTPKICSRYNLRKSRVPKKISDP